MIEKIKHTDKIITDEWEWVNILKKYASPDEADIIKYTFWERQICPIGYDGDFEYEWVEITKTNPFLNKKKYGYISINVNYKEFYKVMRCYRWCMHFSMDKLVFKILESVSHFLSNQGDIQSKIVFKALLDRIEASNDFLNSFIDTQQYLNIKSKKPKEIIANLLAFNKNLYKALFNDYSLIFPDFFKEKEGIDQQENSIISKTAQSLPYKSDIFRNQEAENWFYDMLDEFGVSNAERGFGAVIAGIFKDKDCRNHILKNNLKQKAYIEYLNKKFRKRMNTSNFSNSDNYSNDIEKHITLYIKSLSE